MSEYAVFKTRKLQVRLFIQKVADSLEALAYATEFFSAIGTLAGKEITTFVISEPHNVTEPNDNHTSFYVTVTLPDVDFGKHAVGEPILLPELFQAEALFNKYAKFSDPVVVISEYKRSGLDYGKNAGSISKNRRGNHE